MKKKNLKKLKTLYASSKVIKLARKLKLIKGNRKDYYLYFRFVRCQIEDGILKLAFYFTDDLKMGSRWPRYTVFFDKENRDFITWDTLKEKWRRSMIINLDPYLYPYESKTYVGPKEEYIINQYFGQKKKGMQAACDFQSSIREEELIVRHKKETDAWDAFLNQIPKLPDDFYEWASKDGMVQHYMFYDYSRRKHKTGYCTYCQKEVSLENPQYNQYGVCNSCGHRIQYKSRGKAGRIITERETMYIIQTCTSGFVLREFSGRRFYTAGKYETPSCSFSEVRRVIYDKNQMPRAFYHGLYKQKTYRWVETDSYPHYQYTGYFYHPYYVRSYNGYVYPCTTDILCNEILKKTGLLEWMQETRLIDPERYLYRLRERPYLERIVKAELYALAGEVISGKTAITVNDSKDFAKAIGIDKGRMKRLKEINGGKLALTWFYFEKHQNTEYPNEMIQYMSEQNVEPTSLSFIYPRMSMVKIKNYLEKQNDITGREVNKLISTWRDYLIMSDRLKRDTTKEIFYKPKNLLKAHEEVVSLCESKELTLRAGKLAEDYPKVDQICKDIKPKYEYQGKVYQIVVPDCIEDILREGEALRHCTKYSDIYFDRINRQESYIVFLRKTDAPDTPYYTLEIEPDGTTRQERTIGDVQDKDYGNAVSFIKMWQKEIQKRLSSRDLELAKDSALLRIQELKKLRENNEKIRHGHLQGKLLADVLEADLLLVAEIEKEEKEKSKLAA